MSSSPLSILTFCCISCQLTLYYLSLAHFVPSCLCLHLLPCPPRSCPLFSLRFLLEGLPWCNLPFFLLPHYLAMHLCCYVFVLSTLMKYLPPAHCYLIPYRTGTVNFCIPLPTKLALSKQNSKVGNRLPSIPLSCLLCG